MWLFFHYNTYTLYVLNFIVAFNTLTVFFILKIVDFINKKKKNKIKNSFYYICHKSDHVAKKTAAKQVLHFNVQLIELFLITLPCPFPCSHICSCWISSFYVFFLFLISLRFPFLGFLWFFFLFSLIKFRTIKPAIK